MVAVTRLATKNAEQQVELYAQQFAKCGFDIEVVGLYPERAGAAVSVSRDEFCGTRETNSASFCGAFSESSDLEPSARAAIEAIKGLVAAANLHN